MENLVLFDEKKLVIKSNKIIEARYKLTVLEQKLILFLLTQIKKDDTNFKIFRVKIAQLANFLNIESKDIYRKIKVVTRKMIGRELILRNDEKELQLSWLASAEYFEGQGIVELEISEKLKPFLLQLKEQFTKYQLKNVIQFKSIYSFRIFELLKQYEMVGSRIFLIDELREILDIRADKYPRYNDFRKRVIEKAKNELDSHSDITFDFKEIKDSRKVNGIEFTIYSMPKQRKLNFPGEHENNPGVISALKEIGLSSSQIKKLSKIPEEQIYRNIDYSKGKRDIQNFTGFVYKAILEDYEKSGNKKELEKNEARKRENNDAIVNENLRDFNRQLKKSAFEKLDKLPKRDREKIKEKFFLSYIKENPFLQEIYRKDGLNDMRIKPTYTHFLLMELLEDEDRDFSKFMEAKGFLVEFTQRGYVLKDS